MILTLHDAGMHDRRCIRRRCRTTIVALSAAVAFGSMMILMMVMITTMIVMIISSLLAHRSPHKDRHRHMGPNSLPLSPSTLVIISWNLWLTKCWRWSCCLGQGLTGRVFQLWVGSGSGIGKNYRVGSGLGLGSGIGIIYWINRVLSGIEILDRVFPYFVIFNSLSTWLDIKFGIS